ncbi:MAG: YfcE family phosphodiesterase [Bacilli bacterium]|nr:YfcE family phosphodiesterase [Bacilli bacterium]
MKYLLGSDIHGSVEGLKFLIKKSKDLKCDKIILLGDYFSGDYEDDKQIIELINFLSDKFILIRGNCDRYLSDDVFDVELRDDFLVHIFNRNYLFVHGDYLHFNIDTLLDKDNAFIVHGHTHRVSLHTSSNITFVNIGSISLPRGNSKKCYGTIDENGVKIYDINDHLILSV